MDDSNELRSNVERILYDMGWEDMDGIEDWDGEDLESLRDVLTEEEFETLVDELSWDTADG